MMARRIAFLIVFCMLMPFAVMAQPSSPDYQIYLPNARYEAGQVIVNFSVYNRGTPSDVPATAEIYDPVQNALLVAQTDVIPPLNTGSVHGIELAFDGSRYRAGSTIQIEIVVARPEIEATIFRPMPSNRTTISFEIPIPTPTPIPTLVPTVTPVPEGERVILKIPNADYYFDLGSRDDLILIGAIGVIAGVIGVILLMIFRAIFRSPPQFGNWLPPYANMPTLDPNTIYGRRQQWQSYATNQILPTTNRQGAIVARKVLTGMDDVYLSGWRVKAVRMTQYDMYGRVARSQVLARIKDVKRLDKLIDQAPKLNRQKIERRVRPVAKHMAGQFLKKITRKSAMLAIALDLRLVGRHGEVRILFELYDYPQGKPNRLDMWEPEMSVIGKTIYESYTFTLFGQQGGESFRDFRKRLTRDIERMLADFYLDRTPADHAPVQSSSPSNIRDTAETTPATNPNLKKLTVTPSSTDDVIFEFEDDED
jgi:hypothetical protein